MDSEWALLEFRPGRYVKVTATGEVLGRPTDEEIRAWFASRGWGVDSTPESLSLHLDPQTGAAEDALQTVTSPQPTETQVPGEAHPTTEVVRDGPSPVLTPMPPSGMDSLSHSAEEVPMLVVPELDVPTEILPTEPRQDIEVMDADADKAEASPEPVDGESSAESRDNERGPEPEARETGAGPTFEAPSTQFEPPLGDAVVLPDDVGKAAPEPAREPPAKVRTPAPSHVEAVPARRESQEAAPGIPQTRAAPDADEASAVDGTGRWLWVDPRQEGGYGQGSHDLAAFLSRAVELFEAKPWAGGKNPSRLAVHPDHVTEDLESAAESLGLEVLGDARVMAGTYMLGLADHTGGD